LAIQSLLLMAAFYIVLLVLFYVFTPALILYLCRKFPWINKLGAVVVAYIVGLVAGNMGILPEGADKVQNTIMSITIPLAVPLLLFSSDIRTWFRLAGKTVISLFLGTIMVVATVIAGYFIFRTPAINDFWKVSGMLVGVYTGGTPNLASIALMLNVDPNTYIITHTYDLFVGSVHLLFLMTVARSFFGLFLPPYRFLKPEDRNFSLSDGKNPYEGIFRRKVFVPLLRAFGVAVLIFLLGALPTLFLKQEHQMVVIILVITTLGILASLVPWINKTEKTFEAGMYLILIFSVTVSSMADIQKFSIQSAPILYYIVFVIFGSLLFQALISYFFRIDTDTMLITSTALICSPPFVPVVAGALRNKEIIITGITIGIIGYAIGNYLGFFVARFLSAY